MNLLPFTQLISSFLSGNTIQDRRDLQRYWKLRVTWTSSSTSDLRETFSRALNLIHEAYGEALSGTIFYLTPKKALYLTLWYLGTQSTYREISELFGVSQTTVFECVQRVIDVLCAAGSKMFMWPSPEAMPLIEEKFRSMGGIPGVIGAVVWMDVTFTLRRR